MNSKKYRIPFSEDFVLANSADPRESCGISPVSSQFAGFQVLKGLHLITTRYKGLCFSALSSVLKTFV